MKPGRPVLYELLKEQPRYREGAAHHNGHHQPQARAEPAARPPEKVAAAGGGSGMLSSGRIVRMPVGYLFVGVAVLIIVAAGAYMFGFLRGQDQVAPSDLSTFLAQQENQRLAEGLRDAGRDSSGGGTGGIGAAGSGVIDSLNRTGSSSATDAERSRPTIGSSDPGPILSDPRVSGKRYFRLVQTTRGYAVELSQFCRENGLEAYAVSANNSDLYFVFVLPGFDESDSSTRQQVQNRIEEVRALWRARTGRDDLKGYIVLLRP